MGEERAFLQSFVEEIQGLFGESLKQVILYGSYARGDYQDNSDIDIMILTSLSEAEILQIENEVYDIAYEYEYSNHVQISVNIKNEQHFNYWLGVLPYYNNVREEGVILAG